MPRLQSATRGVVQLFGKTLGGTQFTLPDKIGNLNHTGGTYYHFVEGGVVGLAPALPGDLPRLLNVHNVHIHLHNDGFDVTVTRKGLSVGEQTGHFRYRNAGANFTFHDANGLLRNEPGIQHLQNFCARALLNASRGPYNNACSIDGSLVTESKPAYDTLIDYLKQLREAEQRQYDEEQRQRKEKEEQLALINEALRRERKTESSSHKHEKKEKKHKKEKKYKKEKLKVKLKSEHHEHRHHHHRRRDDSDRDDPPPKQLYGPLPPPSHTTHAN